MLLQYNQLLENAAALDTLQRFRAKPHTYPVCQITYNRDAWVKLNGLPSEYSFDEALLLCQQDSVQWLAWVPDHGEVVLNRSDFYILN
jgi:hypothetical protein